MGTLAPYRRPPHRFNDTAKTAFVSGALFVALIASPWYFVVGVAITVMWRKLCA